MLLIHTITMESVTRAWRSLKIRKMSLLLKEEYAELWNLDCHEQSRNSARILFLINTLQ